MVERHRKRQVAVEVVGVVPERALPGQLAAWEVVVRALGSPSVGLLPVAVVRSDWEAAAVGSVAVCFHLPEAVTPVGCERARVVALLASASE